MMWYGVLGTKELLQRTYKNLEQKVQLEVRNSTAEVMPDGKPAQPHCTLLWSKNNHLLEVYRNI